MLYTFEEIHGYALYLANCGQRVIGTRYSFSDNPLSRYVRDYYAYYGDIVLSVFVARAVTQVYVQTDDGYRRDQIATPRWAANLLEDFDDAPHGGNYILTTDALAILERARSSMALALVS